MTSDVYGEILGMYASMTDLPAPRDPFKFTAAQWERIKAAVPPRLPNTWSSSTAPLPDLTSVPVVIVETEAESTPFLENWGWAARLVAQQWPAAVAEFQRSCGEASGGN